jgi:hypothetical protein
MSKLLSAAALDAIADLGGGVSWDDDVMPALRSVGIDPQVRKVQARHNVVYVPGASSHIHASLDPLDLGDPEVVRRVLRFAARISEVYAASPKADRSKLVRLKHALADDGWSIEPAGDPVAAIVGLAAQAAVTLPDISAIRVELERLERALPADPGAAIGRSKNLIEATAKAVLLQCGQPVTDKDKFDALVSRAAIAVQLHAKQAPEQTRRLLERLSGITKDLGEMRNRVGDGHGATTLPDLSVADGHLAARASIAWCAYLLDAVATVTAQRVG